MYICLMKEVVVKNDDTVIITDRDLDIIYRLSCGDTCGRIGADLEVSKRTIEAHVAKLKSYFESATIPHLVATVIRKGLIK